MELPILSADDWKNIREICEILEPFEDVTIRVNGEYYLVGSQIIALTRGLTPIYGKIVQNNRFNKVAKDLVVNLQRGLMTRFDKLETMKRECNIYGSSV